MYNFINDDIDKVKKVIELYDDTNIHLLTVEQQEIFKVNLRKKYFKDKGILSWSIFEMLNSEKLGVNDANAWSWISDYIIGKEICVLLGENYHSKLIYYFKNGVNFIDVYPRLPFLEFYLMDLNFTFLIGYNHSSCLVTMGKAIDWLESDVRYVKFLDNYKKRNTL